MIELSRADEPCGPEDGVCKIISCLDSLYDRRRGLCETHYYRREKSEEIIEEYPEPLCWLLVTMVENNVEEWIENKPDTHGAEQVRKTGLTSNQKRYADEIADKLEDSERKTGDNNS